MLRAAIIAEQTGVPSVSLVCEGFEGQARATGRGHGFDDVRLAVLAGHVDAQSRDHLLAGTRAGTVEQVISGLVEPLVATDAAGAEPAATDIVATGSLDDIQSRFRAEGWTDGLPIVPPTLAAVERFLAGWGHDPWKRLGIAASSGRDLTVWSVAVNAVMAGCEPAHLPILLALTEILADPDYGMQHSGNTTGADALIVLDGPSMAGLGFNAGPGALRDGTPANTSVGRWLRLYLRNVGGFTAHEHDKATFGNTFRVALTEDHDTLTAIGWPPVSADFGFGVDDDAVTLVRMNSGAIIGSVFGSAPAEIVPYLADGLMRISGWDLTHVHGLGQGHFSPLLVLSPVLARTFAEAGWTKGDVQHALWDHARLPAWRFEKLVGEWTNLTAGRRTLVDMAAKGDVPAEFATADDPDRLVPITSEPARIRIAVSGDPNRTNAYVFSNDGPHGWWTARPVDGTPSLDLVCNLPD